MLAFFMGFSCDLLNRLSKFALKRVRVRCNRAYAEEGRVGRLPCMCSWKISVAAVFCQLVPYNA